MKKFMLLGTMACLFFIPSATLAAPVITEVFANPEDEDHDEVIEIYNPDVEAVDLSGWTITDGDALDDLVAWSIVEHGSLNDMDAVTGSLKIPARGFAIVVDSEMASGNQPYDVPARTMILTVGNTTLGNGLSTTDPVSLMDGSGAVVSTYGTPIVSDDWRNRDDDGLDGIPFNPGDGISVERVEPLAADVEQNWQASMEKSGHSVGFLSTASEEPDPDDDDSENSFPPSDDPKAPPVNPSRPEKTCSTEVVINELLPNPIDSDEDGEFIELFFVGTSALSLEGWTLSDQSGRRYLFSEVVIKPNEYLAVDRRASGIALNNTGEEAIVLTCATGTEADRVSYAGPAEEGWSWSSIENGFRWSIQPTPGQVNVMKSENAPPIAKFVIEGTKEVGVNISFDASDSKDPDGDRLTFAWNFGDGENGSGQRINHVFERSGNFTIRLTVSDEKEEEIVTKHLVIAESTTNEKSMKKKSDELKKNNNTAHEPSEKESLTRTTSDHILLTELLPNPEGPDAEDEWIELSNVGAEDISLQGWIITDEKTSFVFKEVVLRAGERHVVDRPESDISLNNTEDQLYLIDGFGKILHGVAYANAKSGFSFSRRGESDEWGWTEQRTPSEENRFSSFNEDSEDEDEEDGEQNETEVSASDSISNVTIPFVGFDELQSLEKGIEVEVRGTIVSLPGERGVQKMYIQEGDQELQIYSHQKKFPRLHRGDEIAVFGAVSEAGGEKRVNIQAASDIRVLKVAPESSEKASQQVAGASDGLKPPMVDSAELVRPVLAAEASFEHSGSPSSSRLLYWFFGILISLNTAGWFWMKIGGWRRKASS